MGDVKHTIDAVLAELHRRLDAAGRRQPEIDKISEKYGRDWHLAHVPKIKCADGFAMSVQASAAHYCSPRDSEGPWDSVEIGYPTERVESFMPYIDGEDSEPTGTVYGYVPLTIVAQAIIDHGGFARATGAA